MLGIDLLTFSMNGEFVKYVADFISNAWYKRQYFSTEYTLCYIIIIIFVKLILYLCIYHNYISSD